MFTGLIEEVGTIQSVRHGARSCVLTIGCRTVLEGSQIGDSIAVNGVCLTVTSMGGSYYTADVMAETMNRSSLGQLSTGAKVNLERAMPANGRLQAGGRDGYRSSSGGQEKGHALSQAHRLGCQYTTATLSNAASKLSNVSINNKTRQL